MKTSTHTSSPLQHWQSLVNRQRSWQLKSAKLSKFQRAGTMHNLLLPRISSKVLMFVNRACAAVGGAGHMTLAEWRNLEERLNRKLNYEKHATHS